MRVLRSAVLCVAFALAAAAQTFEFDAAAAADPAKSLPELARRVLAVYRDADRLKDLDSRFRLQLVAGQYAEALQTIAELRALRGSAPRLQAPDMQYVLFARAKTMESADVPFAEAFAGVFRQTVGAMDNAMSGRVINILMQPQSGFGRDLGNMLSARAGTKQLSLDDALALIRAYQIDVAYRAFAQVAPPLVEEDDARRYITEKQVAVTTPDGATVCAVLMRPRVEPARVPTLFQFTIYTDVDRNIRDVRRSASNGYAGIVGYTRGKLCSPQKPVPYEYDGGDAAALIDWIAKQRWSDGRVGMYGGSYSGFTAWSAVKRHPKALKAIVVGAPVGPGIDVPMEGNINWSFVYQWTFYTTNNKTLDDATYYDFPRWQRLLREWYVSGRAYRDLEKIDGTPNPVFRTWLDHPSYDAYWRSMIPDREEFAKIDIPILQTAGYYYGGPGAAAWYFAQHLRYDPKAEHYLVIGPYDHPQAQTGTLSYLGTESNTISGYTRDPAAAIDLLDLREQWFDYTLRGGPKPAILADRVNYQVTGANAWKHAQTLEAMSKERLRLHLSKSGKLSDAKPAKSVAIEQVVDLTDRSDADQRQIGGGVLDSALNMAEGLAFVSEPFKDPVEMSGLFSGHLDFVTNKKDFDVSIELYEKTPAGQYMQLAPYWSRASYMTDPSHRHLLTPGKRTRLDFRAIRLMSHQFSPGGRLVVVLRVLKEGSRQINYGSGKEVSDETIADAKAPVRIRWFSDSYIEVPVTR